MAIAVVLGVGSAWADTAKPSVDKPWAAGVPEAEQATALAMYREGNTEFQESRYAQALVKYRDALKHWDHPAIRFNMAVCLVNLDQPLEAYEHLIAALKYNDAPIGADAYAQGLTYKKLLLGQLANLKVTSDIDGAEVTLDGKPLLKGKGEAAQMLVPGAHQVVASKAGFVTETASLVLLPGKDTVHAVHLLPIVIRTHMVRRWNARTPWIIAGVGAGTAALGGLFEYLAFKDHRAYDSTLMMLCQAGCPESVGASEKSAARTENIAGVSLLVVGGAGLAIGLVGVYLNVPRAVVEHAPVVTPTLGGAMTTIGWSF